MRLLLGLVLVAGLAIPLVGCGRSDPSPDGTPRGTVVGFLDDVQAGRPRQACAVLDPEAVRELRLALLGVLRVPAGTRSERLRFIERARTTTMRSCPAIVRLLRDQHGDELPSIRRSAATAEASRPFPAQAWMIGDEDWWVEARDGRWVITTANAATGAEDGS